MQAPSRKKTVSDPAGSGILGKAGQKTIRAVAEAFGLSPTTVKKYIYMTEAEINGLDIPDNYKKRYSPMNDWLNVIFKMMLDG